MKERTGREAGFRKLVQFVVYKAEVKNSIHGRMDWSNRINTTERRPVTQKRKPAVFNTIKEQPKNFEPKPTNVCLYCKKSQHDRIKSKDFQNLTYQEEIKFAKDQRLCFLCLKGKHWAYSCESNERCNKKGCENRRHHTLLHDQERDKPVEVPQEEASTSKPTMVCSTLNPLSSRKGKNSLPLLATLPVKVGYGQLEFFTYALLDSGSQQSFCTRRLVDNLKLKGEDHEMRLHAMTQTGEGSDLKGELVTFSVSS